MKNILAILACVTCLAMPALSQITNAIKISVLPTGSAPTGTELVPVVQSGATVSLTVNQIIAAPEALALAYSNYLALALGTNVANVATASNSVTTVTTTVTGHTATLAALATATNTLTLALGTNVANVATVSNSLTTLTTTVTGQSASISTLNTEASTQQGQITALQAASGNVGTNGGTLALTQLQLTTFQILTAQVPSGTVLTNLIDFSRGANQTVNVGFGNSVSGLVFEPSNVVDGENVFLFVVCTNGIAGSVGTASNVPSFSMGNWTSQSSTGPFGGVGGWAGQLTGARKQAVINWSVFKTNILYSATISQ